MSIALTFLEKVRARNGKRPIENAEVSVGAGDAGIFIGAKRQKRPPKASVGRPVEAKVASSIKNISDIALLDAGGSFSEPKAEDPATAVPRMQRPTRALEDVK